MRSFLFILLLLTPVSGLLAAEDPYQDLSLADKLNNTSYILTQLKEEFVSNRSFHFEPKDGNPRVRKIDLERFLIVTYMLGPVVKTDSDCEEVSGPHQGWFGFACELSFVGYQTTSEGPKEHRLAIEFNIEASPMGGFEFLGNPVLLPIETK